MNPFHAQLPDNPARPRYWHNLHGSSSALGIYQAASKFSGTTLVVTHSGRQAHLLERDLHLLGDSTLPVIHFPDWETLPYDLFSPHAEIISTRIATLNQLQDDAQRVVVIAANTLLQKIPPKDFVLARSFVLKTGQQLDIQAFRQRLLDCGYQTSEQVYQPGHFAVRGAVIDVFPGGSQAPFRLDLFDTEIDTIRYFDPETQRSTETVQQIQFLPAREFPTEEEALSDFRRAFRTRFDVDTREVGIYQDLRADILPQGLEQYLPLFFSATASFLDYLPAQTHLVMQQEVETALSHYWQQIAERHEQRRYDIERPILEPAELYFEQQDVRQRLQQFPRAILCTSDDAGHQAGIDFATAVAPDLFLHEKTKQPAQAFKAYLENSQQRILIAADSPGRREVLLDTLRSYGIPLKAVDSFSAFCIGKDLLAITVAPLEQGFCLTSDPLVTVLTEAQLFGGRTRPSVQRTYSERDPEAIIRNLNDLNSGAPVVHEDHGVGRYLGLEHLVIDDQPAEFLTLEYADGDKLYVPVSSLHLISRYTGASPENAPLHRLGSEQWQKAKRRAAKKVEDIAAELLDLYAKRQARPGFAFQLDQALYAEFAASFPFEETPDQQYAIDAVIADMQSPLPMDRVICGDVGFGKTEVALRAAFVAAQAGKQVAILAPTTLLVQQHFRNFSDRFADWPVRVAQLSRFTTGKTTQETLAGIKSGAIDIVVGTHRVIQRDIRFSNLGLVIIDEEQRFGVKQKERLKALRAEVDLLTLTATPIPRTLNMAMSGLRDLSIIATPPARRLPVKTFVASWDKPLLREALQRELQRGGQAYVLHNEVTTIERVAKQIQNLLPEARLTVAHGQMRGRELEQIMADFYRQRFNILVCTTIIENGIDVPTANTIIVNRADKFGLAQLHQLRGRVGRSHHRAYAYLLIPGEKSITKDAKKRLEAIESYEELGAGFMLATHDLEIRGAGELLGDEQSGQIHEIGFTLYTDLLNRAIKALKAGDHFSLEDSDPKRCEIELHLPALIPGDYLPDVHTRLTLYKRIASAKDTAALRALQVEMIDRFGLLPQASKNLFAIAELKLTASELMIKRIDYSGQGGYVEFSSDTQADPKALLQLLQSEPEQYQLAGPERLRLLKRNDEPAERIQFTQNLLHHLGQA